MKNEISSLFMKLIKRGFLKAIDLLAPKQINVSPKISILRQRLKSYGDAFLASYFYYDIIIY